MSKYQFLNTFLKATPLDVNEITLSFEQISLVSQLPNSAHIHRAWWSNQKDIDNRPQAKAWIEAGFVVSSVNQKFGWVKFTRKLNFN